MIRFETTSPRPVHWHEYANLFPWLAGADMDTLREDIRQNGIREPVVFLGDAILDGRNRYQCARDLGIAYPRREFGDDPADGDDPLAFVISLNLTRRHLTEPQRASVAAKLANMPRGFRSDRQPPANLPDVSPPAFTSTRRAAELLSVSERSVTAAKAVHRDGVPELVDALDRGQVSVLAASAIATRPREEQAQIVARGEAEILAAARAIRAERADRRREARDARLIELSAHNAPLPEGRRWPVLYADPPWRYDFGPNSRSVENHYPTMEIGEILALDVASLATPDAVLFLWVPPTLLRTGFDVLEAWDFRIASSAVWDKEVTGLGKYFRMQHEFLLVGTRGNPIAPREGDAIPSVIRARRTQHSAKPVEVAEAIERYYPGLPRIELFCRSPRPGWDVWGNQAVAA